MKPYETNLLFTSSGRRVSLIRMFKEYVSNQNRQGNIITADYKNNAPSTFISDKHYTVPKVSDENYISELIQICRKENITGLIPLIDTELPILSQNKHLFEEIGVKVLVSNGSVIEISCDKVKTYKFFLENDIPTPKVYSEEDKDYQFPLIVKPRDGSSSVGVTIVNNEYELQFFKQYIRNSMVQELVTGDEYTVDVMVDYYGNSKTIIPRQRIETRAGEVSKGMTKNDSAIIEAVKDAIQKMTGVIGCINLQCFKKENGEITLIEINPRFGGGAPLSIQAGANFPKWTIELIEGQLFTETDNSWKDGLTMLRYDDAIFMEQVVYAD